MMEEQKTTESEPEKSKPAASVESKPVPQAKSVASSEPSFAARAVRWVFRMLVAILLGVALGAGIFYGARSFYRDAIEPLQTLDQRMREVESGVSDLSEDVREERSSFSGQIADLQGRLAVQAEELATMSAQISRIELQAKNQDEALGAITDLRDNMDQIEEDLASTDEKLAALAELVEAGELPAAQVEHRLQLMRVMNILTRARLWIEQDNFGLASEDIEAALEIMQSLTALEETGDEAGDQLPEITERLTLALETTRTDPALAEEELEVVWKLLIEATAP
ncbi:MAG: hypothetical protein P1P76_08140 [Anaerolineales bacterium]|nr:hypothetical protein [Anaerolineales bacterium]